MSLKRKIFKFFLKNLPSNKFFDNLLSFIQFTYIHKRLPSKKKYFNDVLYQIKTSNIIDDPLRIFVTDKEYCKIFLKEVINHKHVIKNLLVTDKIQELINFNSEIDYIIKPTHLAGKYIIKKKNEKFTTEDINAIKNNWLVENQYFGHRERNYLNLKPKIIIEPLLFNDDNIKDYKIFCNNGVAKVIQVDFNRSFDHSRSIYTLNWEKLDMSIDFKMNDFVLEKPNNLSEMIILAEKISKFFSFIRIDMYSNNNEIFIGEITHIHGGACEKFLPNKFETEKEFSKILFE